MSLSVSGTALVVVVVQFQIIDVPGLAIITAGFGNDTYQVYPLH